MLYSIVISLFAIVILSVIGSMFANGNHSMMGSEEDPKDGGKVATAVFGAVGVYGVSWVIEASTRRWRYWMEKLICDHTGVPPLLREPSTPAPETESTRRDSAAVSVVSRET